MYWALIGGAATFLVLVLDVRYPVPDWIKKVTTLRTSLEMLKVAYYNFWMKTIDFFKWEHFQQLRVSTGLLIT